MGAEILEILVYDFFAGAGGDTTGIENAKHRKEKIAKVIAAINHDNLALASHKANHKHVVHFVEDIRDFNPDRFPKIKKRTKRLVVIWASLECTNFSNAKGGLPRDPDSRTLANELFRYEAVLNPDYIIIENVKEFMAWGPLVPRVLKKGKSSHGPHCPLYLNKKTGEMGPSLVPESRTKGRDYLRWVNRMCSRGYQFDSRLLNAANYGAFTNRTRFFGIFAKQGLPISFPKPTHSKTGKNGFKKWRAVREVLELENEGESIFNRKTPLVDNTLRRFLAGLKKHGPKPAGGDDRWMVKYLSNDPVTGANAGADIDNPAPTITTQNRLYIAKADFIQNYYSTGDNVSGTDQPAGTVTTKDRSARVVVQFLDKRYGSGDHNHQNIDEPAGALTNVPKLALVTPTHWLDKQYAADANHQSVDQPAGTLTQNPKFAFVTANRFVMPTNYDNSPHNLDQPTGAITANRKWHYLVNPQYQNVPAGIDDPCFTLIARMDKKPPCLVTTEEGYAAIRIDPEDSPVMRELKCYMAENGIVDIKMRMLTVLELKRITGFSDDYILLGNQSDQKKFIGNAVPPVLAKVIIEALYKANIEPAKAENPDYGLFAA